MTRFEKLKGIIDCLRKNTINGYIERNTTKLNKANCKDCKDIQSCFTITQALFELKGDFDG